MQPQDQQQAIQQMAQELQGAQQQMMPQDMAMQQPRRRFDVSRFVSSVANVMTGGMAQQQPARINLMGSQQQRFGSLPQGPTKISLFGNRQNNILNAPNIFNRRGDGRMPLV